MSRVYFIKPVGLDGPIKIGCSVAPDNRRKTLATWSPFALEIIAEIEGDFDLERRFHALFAETHQRREWFGWSKRLAAVIEQIKAGSFDLATLPAPICITAIKGKGSRPRVTSEAARFAMSFQMRRHHLRSRGAPWAELIAGPSFDHYCFGDGPYAHRHAWPDNPPQLIRDCEAFIAKMTEKYGHERMKPVRWEGPYPPMTRPTTDQTRVAA